MADLRHRFGAKLRQLRREADLTQEELAAQANISVDFLSLVERGVNAPSFKNIEKLAKALGVPIQELFSFSPHDSNT